MKELDFSQEIRAQLRDAEGTEEEVRRQTKRRDRIIGISDCAQVFLKNVERLCAECGCLKMCTSKEAQLFSSEYIHLYFYHTHEYYGEQRALTQFDITHGIPETTLPLMSTISEALGAASQRGLAGATSRL